MNANQQPSKDPIPEFATREEEAEFWDTHDFTDYWDDLEPANVEVNPNLKSSFLVPLDGKSLTQLCQQADAKGVDAETLMRTWILERLASHSNLGSIVPFPTFHHRMLRRYPRVPCGDTERFPFGLGRRFPSAYQTSLRQGLR